MIDKQGVYEMVYAKPDRNTTHHFVADVLEGILFDRNPGEYTLKTIHYFIDPRNPCNRLRLED